MSALKTIHQTKIKENFKCQQTTLAGHITFVLFTGLTVKNYFTGKFTGNWPVKLIPKIDNPTQYIQYSLQTREKIIVENPQWLCYLGVSTRIISHFSGIFMDKLCNCSKPDILISQVFHASLKEMWTIMALMSGAVAWMALNPANPALNNAGTSRVCIASEPRLYRVHIRVV